jgi:hypothetical protein
MDGLDLGIFSAGTGYWYEILNKLIFIRYNTYVPVNEILLLSANSFRHFCLPFACRTWGKGILRRTMMPLDAYLKV